MKPSKQKALKLIREQLEAIPNLKGVRQDSPEFRKWWQMTRTIIGNLFGPDSSQLANFGEISYDVPVWSTATPESSFQRAYVRGLESHEGNLEALAMEISTFWEDDAASVVPVSAARPANVALTKDVFLVHGHDEEMKQSVARTLMMLGLNPIILHEQANKGKTIVEKFEANTGTASFAVVLLSPDDIGLPTDHILHTPATSRPRQNVVLELGYFVGKLGRARVLPLKRGENLELPSDLHGLAYTDYDPAGRWRLEMVKELKEAGYAVDANSLL